jgi:hypothetical protein
MAHAVRAIQRHLQKCPGIIGAGRRQLAIGIDWITRECRKVHFATESMQRV